MSLAIESQELSLDPSTEIFKDGSSSPPVEPQYDGVVMLSDDLLLFDDAIPRPDGQKIYHIFERAPEGETFEDRNKISQKDKKDLCLSASRESFCNIEKALLVNGILVDDWCPPLTESGQNSRNNSADSTTLCHGSPLKSIKTQIKEEVCEGIKKEMDENSISSSSSRFIRIKRGKENDDASATDEETSTAEEKFSSKFKRSINGNKDQCEVRKFYCTECSFSTLYKCNLKTHFLRHGLNYPKSLPGFSANNKTQSKNRKLSREGKIFSCNNCDFSTDYQNDLKKHQLLHSKVEKYSCSKCEFFTAHKSSLKVHTLKHLDEKKYTCSICNYSTNFLFRIKIHIDKKHEESGIQFQNRKLYDTKNESKSLDDDMDFDRNDENNVVNVKEENTNEPSGSAFLPQSYTYAFIKQEKTEENEYENDADLQTVKIKLENDFVKSSDDSNSCKYSLRNPSRYKRNNVCIVSNTKTSFLDEKPQNKINEPCSNNKNLEILPEFEKNRNENNITIKKEIKEEAIYKDNRLNIDFITNLKEPKVILHRLKENIIEEINRSQINNTNHRSLRNRSLKINEVTTIKKEDSDTKPTQEDTFYYKSSECDYKTLCKYKFIHHNNTHKKNMNFNCSYCHFTAKCLFILKEHQKIHPKIEGKQEVNNSVSTNTDILWYKSSECSYKTKYKSKIIQHNNTHKKNVNFNCSSCDFTAKCLFVLKEHRKTHTETYFKCIMCPFNTNCKSTIAKHKILKHMNIRKDQKFSLRSSKVKSVNIRASISKTNLKCGECDFVSSDKEDYQQHLRTHKKHEIKSEKKEQSSKPKNLTSKNSKKQEEISSSLNSEIPDNENLEVGKKKLKTSIKKEFETSVKEEFNCSKCSFGTNTERSLVRHEKRHIKEEFETSIKKEFETSVKEEFNCSKCSFGTNTERSLVRHEKRHIKEEFETSIKKEFETSVKEEFNCSKCSFRTDTERSLVRHEKRHITFTCDLCPFKTSRKAKLKEHKNSHDSSNIFKCQICSFESTLKISFLKHKQVHFPQRFDILKCTECSFRTKKNKVLISHLMSHAYKYSHRCLHCNFSSNSKQMLNVHKNSHRNSRIKRNYRSYRTGKITVAILPKHKQKLKCFKCDYTCNTEHLLNQHSLTHLENKRLKCAHCNFETNFKGNLVVHILTHENDEDEDIIEVKDFTSNSSENIL